MAVTTAMPVPVFAAVGAGAHGAVQELRARPELRLVATPRHAAVLLIAGRIAAHHRGALDRVHDQVPHPRAVVPWQGNTAQQFADTAVHGGSEGVAAAVVDAFARVQADPSASTPDRLPDEEPNEWRGIGPFGQGGEGMMGGTPFGRPMAMTGDDRDGLALDQLHLRLGPFLAWLPPGVALDVTMQGEILQEVTPRLAPSSPEDLGSPLRDEDPTPVREALRWLALALHVHGLDALASRAARLAASQEHARDERRRLCRAVRRSGLFWSISGVGRIEGLGDAADRWRRRLGKIDHAEEPERDSGPGEHIGLSWDGLAEQLRGLTFTDAVTTVVSALDHLVQPVEEVEGR